MPPRILATTSLAHLSTSTRPASRSQAPKAAPAVIASANLSRYDHDISTAYVGRHGKTSHSSTNAWAAAEVTRRGTLAAAEATRRGTPTEPGEAGDSASRRRDSGPQARTAMYARNPAPAIRKQFAVRVTSPWKPNWTVVKVQGVHHIGASAKSR